MAALRLGAKQRSSLKFGSWLFVLFLCAWLASNADAQRVQRILQDRLSEVTQELQDGGQQHHHHLPHHMHADKAAADGIIHNPDEIARLTSTYFSNEELGGWLQNYTQRCGAISRVFSIGRSVEERDLWVLEISDHAGLDEPKPQIKYVANMHGDEPSGRQILLSLAEWLCQNRESDPRAARIIRDTHLYLLPSMNPDGFQHHRRENSRGQDLNRDFPDPFKRNWRAGGTLEASGQEQPETLSVMEWMLDSRFVASAQLHEGAVVVNYPWDGSDDQTTKYMASPDDVTFRHLAAVYAATVPRSPEFAEKDGITNGAGWYPLYGGMQDWNYIVAHCMELTIEVSENKWPEAGEPLSKIWRDNLDSLLAYPLQAVFGGVRGFVREKAAGRRLRGGGSKPVAAAVRVTGIDHVVYASKPFGDYYRPLAPGTYEIVASARGYENATAIVTVPANGTGVILDFELTPLASAAGIVKSAIVDSIGGTGAASEVVVVDDTMLVLPDAADPPDLPAAQRLWMRTVSNLFVVLIGLALIQGGRLLYARLAGRPAPRSRGGLPTRV